jgi:two-component system, cell cycle response regulator
MRSESNPGLQPVRKTDPDGSIPIPRSRARHSCRVLVVDDDDLVRRRLATLLAPRYDVEVAASAAEALDVLSTKECHIVLTDWLMPKMDGLALCRKVRRRVQENYIYVLMLTIRHTRHDILTGLAAGVDDYVVKGAPPREILARVEIGRRIAQKTHFSGPRAGLNHTDQTTGAYNLSYLVQHLPRELARSLRHGHALAVLTCGIGGFEQIDDLEAGDELLRTFVARSVGSLRKGDWLARTSSNEFMIVLPETTAQGARCVARKLRDLFALDPLSKPDDSSPFSVQIGVTAAEEKHHPNGTVRIDALIRAAFLQLQTARQLSGQTSTNGIH